MPRNITEYGDLLTNGIDEWGHIRILSLMEEGQIALIASPIGLPIAITQPATSITADAARINGKIDNDGGEACDVRFRWRKILVS